MSSYVIRGGEQGKARLQVLGAALQPSTHALLQRAGITSGMVCLDLGCGGGDVTFELARLAGIDGTAVGMDIDSTVLHLAQQDAERQGIANVAFHLLDATALDAVAAYDLVYARFLLTHVRDPLAVVQRMVRATRPGGTVVVEDLDHTAIFCYPACRALEQHMMLYDQVTRLRGADPTIGPKLPSLFRQAGLQDLEMHVVQPTFMEGNAKRIHQITLTNIREAVIAASLATQGELDALVAEMDAFAQNPETLISFPRIVQVWARTEA